LTNKLLAALGIAGALFIGATADASANPWRGGRVYRAPMVYRAPVYRTPVFVPRAPVVYSAPTYAPAYAPAYPGVYGATYAPVIRPVYGVGWRHPWVRGYGRRW
jgi:hypothetical protein